MPSDPALPSPVALDQRPDKSNRRRVSRRRTASKPESAAPTSTGDLRLSKALGKRYAELKREYTRLESAIIGATTKSELEARKHWPGFVGRRVLKKLIEGKGSAIVSIAQLQQIDAYLCRADPDWRAHSLTLPSSVVAGLAGAGHVTLWDGKKPPAPLRTCPPGASYHRADADIEAALFLEARLKEYAAEIRIERESVKLLGRWDETRELLGQDRCSRFLLGGKRADVMVGSPLANPLCEVGLSAMGEVEAFRCNSTHFPALPFRLIWPDDARGAVESSFALRVAALAESHPALAQSLVGTSSRGLLVDGRLLLVDPPEQRDSCAYGIVAMQLRADGSVWVVVFGLNAVGTLVATKGLPLITERPRAPIDGRHGPVLWCLIRSRRQVLENDAALILANARPELVEVHHWQPEPTQD